MFMYYIVWNQSCLSSQLSSFVHSRFVFLIRLASGCLVYLDLIYIAIPLILLTHCKEGLFFFDCFSAMYSIISVQANMPSISFCISSIS